MIKLNGSLSNLPQQEKQINKLIKINNSLNNSFSFNDEPEKNKLNLLKMNQMNRSNSVDLATSRTIRLDKVNAKSTDLTTHTLIELHKFLKDKEIYTNPNDNYKRRTIVLIRSPIKKASTPLNASKQRHLSHFDNFNNGEFGFHLQTYGLVNSTTKQTEFICFVNNVQPNSPAQQSGLNNGDVILAIDGICINEFKSLNEIMTHVRGKLELRLVVMCENICKKIQLKQRYGRLKQTISEKKLELERITKQEENIFQKYNINPRASNTSSLSSSSSSSSPIENSYEKSPNSEIDCFVSPNQLNKAETSNDEVLIKNSTPNEQTMSTSTSSTSSNSYSSTSSLALTPTKSFSENRKIPAIVAAVMSKAGNNLNVSKSSPNGTARITVENTFTSPLTIPSTSSSASSFTSDETPASNNSKLATSFSSFNKPELLFLKQTPRMSRSALSSSMSFLSKLNNNFRGPIKHANQFTNPTLNRMTIIDSPSIQADDSNLMLRNKANSLENSLVDSHNKVNQSSINDSDNEFKIKIVNYVSLSDSFTPALSSLSTSTTSSSLSSSSSISPNLSLTNSITDKSFNLKNSSPNNEIDSGVGVGIGLVAADKPVNNNLPIFKYASENYVITRL